MSSELTERVGLLETRVDAGEMRLGAIEARLGVIEKNQVRHSNALMSIQMDIRDMAQNLKLVLSLLNTLGAVKP